MHQNRNNTGYRKSKNQHFNINTLNNDLMSKISNLQEPKNPLRPPSSKNRIKDTFFCQIQDLEVLQLSSVSKVNQNQQPKSILEKAKLITQKNKNQIQKAKNLFKKTNPQTDQMFLTGCGLYSPQNQFVQKDDHQEQVDMNDALKYLVSHEKDDLQELRRMIKKTSINIEQYSYEVNKTKKQIINAADLFGKELNLDLRMKIHKQKPIQNNFCDFPQKQIVPKRRISTSHKQRPKNIF